MQVDPIKPKLKPPGTKRLKLQCDIMLSTSAFKFNLRLYTEAPDADFDFSAAYDPVTFSGARHGRTWQILPRTRGLHSSASRLNLSRF